MGQLLLPKVCLSLLLLACFLPGSLYAKPPASVALLPFACVGGVPKACARLREDLAARLERKFGHLVKRGAKVDAAVRKRCGKAEDWWACLEQDANLFAIGRSLKVAAALTVRVASLGERQAVKLRWVDVASSTISVELVEARPGDVDAWMSSLVLLHQRLYVPPAPPPPPAWYQRWEVWTSVGAGAVLVTGLVLAITLAPSGNDQADFSVRLP